MALRSILIVGFVAYALFIALFLRYGTNTTFQNEITPQVKAPPTVKAATVERGVPVQLTIPNINVSAPIESVGIAADGTMDVKKNPDIVAWYNLGARPGNSGSAVIAGHYGWDNGKGSVFNELHTLKAGDKLSVSDQKGMATSFVVRESRRYDPAADASTIFRSNDGKSHLNLITCEGVWNKERQTYSKRLVVFTDKE